MGRRLGLGGIGRFAAGIPEPLPQFRPVLFCLDSHFPQLLPRLAHRGDNPILQAGEKLIKVGCEWHGLLR